MSKYHNTKSGGFDSKKEERRYYELKSLEESGKISGLKRQVEFELIPKQEVGGKVVERACKYRADFLYLEDGKTVVEDVKGWRTDVYRIKKKLMLMIYGIQIREV